MAKHNKVYGFVNALWEVGTTCPSLFRMMADWMESHAIRPTSLWKAMIEASWAPSPLRLMLKFLSHRDRHGDRWSLCHYWSNFEIGDMDFFRGQQYQELFDYLDANGGFYSERVSVEFLHSDEGSSDILQWGDAAVHSLAVAMMLEPQQVHHFEDFGYRHGTFYRCPANARGGQLPDSALLEDTLPEGNPEVDGGIGCRCQCDRRPHGERNFSGYCAARLKQPSSRHRMWLQWVLLERMTWMGRALLIALVGTSMILVIRCCFHRWTRRATEGLAVVVGLTIFLHILSYL